MAPEPPPGPTPQALADRAPEEFAKWWRQAWSEDSGRTAGSAKQSPAGAVHADSSVEEPDQLFVPPSKGGPEEAVPIQQQTSRGK
jgi:hypothetical protein